MLDFPDLRRLIEEIIHENTVVDGFKVSHDFPGVGKKTFLLNARRIAETKLNPAYILLAMVDADIAAVQTVKSVK